ncbi:hypothetical protein QQ020_24575 [Fulvivirgaceae bacterium BMA12]|uniref:Uncharacterized protein n=1 Tax=Agaribacillus aureus TaxID=3051825 RepID=A0ABT8LBX2_9BACT|nr:hypothetical protein [Fulvivirgaceae bacterium BMA12]
MFNFFRTVRPLLSEKVNEILGDHKEKNKLLEAIYKLREGDESAAFQYDGKKYTLRSVREQSIKKAS